MNQDKYDVLMMDIAYRTAGESHAVRRKVGAVVEKDGAIISMGWNGMPEGFDNNCEDVVVDGSLVTKKEVLHAEANALMKLAKNRGDAKNSTLYITLTPCFNCAKMIHQAGIKRVVYQEDYTDMTSLEFLRNCNIIVEKGKG